MRPLSISEDAYTEAATEWAEAGNDPEAFPTYGEWLRMVEEEREL